MRHKKILALFVMVALVNMASTTVGAFESELVDIQAHVTPSPASIDAHHQWLYDLLNGLGETSIVSIVEGP